MHGHTQCTQHAVLEFSPVFLSFLDMVHLAKIRVKRYCPVDIFKIK